MTGLLNFKITLFKGDIFIIVFRKIMKATIRNNKNCDFKTSLNKYKKNIKESVPSLNK